MGVTCVSLNGNAKQPKRFGQGENVTTIMLMPKQRPTIRDVAMRAGVSVTTVSHTFSGNGVVSEATKLRVRAAATGLGYYPDVVASGLRRKRLGVIGLMLRFVDGVDLAELEEVDYFSRFAGAAALAALGQGYALMLVADPTVEGAPPTAFACDGIIITDPVSQDPLTAALQASGTPYTLVGVDLAAPDDPHVVDIATELIVDRVLGHLAAAGASRPALVVGTDSVEWCADTERFFRQRRQDAGGPVAIVRIPHGTVEDNVSSAIDQLLSFPERPDGVYCLTSYVARGVVDRLVELGIRVPEDVAVMSGSDAECLRNVQPTITAVDLRPEELGRQAATELLRQLNPERELPVSLPEHGTLIVRSSTARGSGGVDASVLD